VTAPTPDVSVVIPTHRRETRLAFALEALAAQTLNRDRFEVVVVSARNGGPLPPAPEGLRVRFLTFDGEGSISAQRNLGWRSAEAPLVAFMDDDCRPTPAWLERMIAASDGSLVFVQGRTEPDPDEVHLLYGQARSQEITEPSEWFEACNIAYPRDLLERLEGFDESFRYVSEDTDLGLRARQLGAERVYADDALVWHAVLPRTLPAALREAVERHPLLILERHRIERKALYRGFFIRRSHARLTLALVGLIVFRRRPLIAAAFAFPYVGKNLDRWRVPPRRLPRMLGQLAYHLPFRLIVDLVEMAVTLRDAIRYRFPAL
jgi:GT2 family glycosyltransferase